MGSELRLQGDYNLPLIWDSIRTAGYAAAAGQGEATSSLWPWRSSLSSGLWPGLSWGA